MAAILSDAVIDLTAATEKLRADGRLVASADQMLNELETILDTITSLQAEVVHRLRDAFNADAASEACGRSLKAWLREEMLLSGADASRLLRLLHHLRFYPETEAAFDTAVISIAHVGAILAALESLPAHLRSTIEPHLVERARSYPPEEIAGFVDELLQALGIDKLSEIRRERRNAQRGVDLHKTVHGNRSLTGTLNPDVGEQLERALALAGQPAGPEDDRTPRQRAHDALGTIANAYLGTGGAPSFTGTPSTAIITMDHEQLLNQLLEGSIMLPDGGGMSAATARRLACDAEIIPIVLGSNSEILDIGQSNREFTVPIRRAAYARDGGRCAFPGCRGNVSELHHIVFRRRGGPTSLANAAWLCAYHHWLAHEGHWTLERTPTGDYLWTGPNGQQRIRHLSTA